LAVGSRLRGFIQRLHRARPRPRRPAPAHQQPFRDRPPQAVPERSAWGQQAQNRERGRQTTARIQAARLGRAPGGLPQGHEYRQLRLVRSMSGGWRVRRDHARRRAQFHRNWRNPFPGLVQASPSDGPSEGVAETPINTGYFQAVQAVQPFSSESPQEENTQRDEAGARACECVAQTGVQNRLDRLDRLDSASNGAAFPGPGAPASLGPIGPRICERCRHFRRDPGPHRMHRCRLGGDCLSQRQRGECGKEGRLWEPRS
jgi:hypothetical protein